MVRRGVLFSAVCKLQYSKCTEYQNFTTSPIKTYPISFLPTYTRECLHRGFVMVMLSPAEFREQHGDCQTWTVADMECYEHLVECGDPTIARAVVEGLSVVGCHCEEGQVVVDL